MAENEKVDELVDEKVQQENIKDRLAFEYTYNRTNAEALGVWLEAVVDGREANTTNCPTEVFIAQYHAMCAYIAALELRIQIMGIFDEEQGSSAEVTD